MRYFLIAGEASGDMHGAALMREIKKTDAEAEFCLLGGDAMLLEGGSLVQHYKNMAFMGVFNVLVNIGKIAENFNLCKKAMHQFAPDVVILIDYPGFNLKMAKYVKKHLNLPVYYYIAPKLWAWKEYRIKRIKRYVDRMFTIFPFETQYFAKLGYKVDYVGNPTAEVIDKFLSVAGNSASESDDLPSVALLCGSRRQEVAKCLPVMAKMAHCYPQYRFVIAAAPNIDTSFYSKFISNNIEVVYGDTYNVLRRADVAVVNSGTATLETALIGTPQVVVYHVVGGWFVPLLRKIFIKIPYVSLVNLIAGKEVVKELITPHFNEANLADELGKIINNEKNRQNILNDYGDIRNKLGRQSASSNAAKAIYEYLMQDRIKKS